jgi:hypothetical protein
MGQSGSLSGSDPVRTASSNQSPDSSFSTPTYPLRWFNTRIRLGTTGLNDKRGQWMGTRMSFNMPSYMPPYAFIRVQAGRQGRAGGRVLGHQGIQLDVEAVLRLSFGI